MFKNQSSLTINYKPENRLVSDYDLFASLRSAILQNISNERELKRLEKLQDLVTRLTVENSMLKKAVLEKQIMTKEIEEAEQLQDLVTRLTVENGILKNKIKRLKEEKECFTVTKN